MQNSHRAAYAVIVSLNRRLHFGFLAGKDSDDPLSERPAIDVIPAQIAVRLSTRIHRHAQSSDSSPLLRQMQQGMCRFCNAVSFGSSALAGARA